MITIPRSLTRQLRVVFRQAGIHKQSGGFRSKLLFLVTPEGLRIRAMSFDVAIEYRQPHEGPPEEIVVPFEFLTDCEGRSHDPVTLESSTRGVVASWSDHGVPQLTEYPAAEIQNLSEFPPVPDQVATNEPSLWQALHNSGDCTDPNSSRYSLGNVQLQGRHGKLAATDGHHLFVQASYEFPWQEDLLVPKTALFRSAELPQKEPIAVGKAGNWIAFGIGPWVIWLAIQEGRFPKIDSVIPAADAAPCRLRLSPADVEFLAEKLPRLPSDDDQFDPVTLDLNGQVVVRSKPEGEGAPTELVLRNSECQGEPVTISINRKYLARALKLGFSELSLYGADSPVLCDDGRRQYMWMPISQAGIVKASPSAIRIESSAPAGDVSKPQPQRKRDPMPQQSKPESAPKLQPETSARPVVDESELSQQIVSLPPIEQAVLLRDALRVAANQANQLIGSLKRQKRQSRIVQSTLDSLKQLGKLAG